MIDKETWNVETDSDKIIKYKMSLQYHKKCLLFKKFISSNIKQSVFSMNDSFLNTMN